MNTEQFTDHAPGRLVPCELREVRVKNGIEELAGIRLSAFVANPLPPDIDWKSIVFNLRPDDSHATHALGRLNGLHKRLGSAAGLLRTLWMREAKLSSEVEGIETTAEEMVLAGAGRDVGVREQGIEAWNYVRALEHGVGSDLPMCNRLIKEMHFHLLKGVRGDENRPGEFRQDPVFIGNKELGPRRARFIPAPPGELLEQSMADFEQFAHNYPKEIPPLFAIALMHYQFETIHPFRDGNGRIGRVLISRSLVKENLLDHPVVYMSAYINEHKQEYVDRLLAVSTRGEWEAWIRFMITAIATQCEDAIARSEALISLQAEYRARTASYDSSINLQTLVDKLFEQPAINAAEVSSLLSVTPPTAYRYLESLEETGILKEYTGKSRNRDWIAPGVLAVIHTHNPVDIKPESEREARLS